MTTDTVRLGQHEVGRIGYGAMQLEDAEPASGIALLRRAVELGVDHVDTAQFYGTGTVNRLLRAALHPYDGVRVVTKVGATRTARGELVAAQRPAELRAEVEANLATLGVERLDVVNLRRVDAPPGIVATGEQVVDLEDQLAELGRLRDEGKLAAIGLSSVSAAQVERAAPAGPVCVQNAHNVLERRHEDVLAVTERLGIAWVPFFPLGSAFDGLPSVTAQPAVVDLAARLAVTPSQVGLAWLLARSNRTLLIPGTRSEAHLVENLAAGDVELDADALAVLDGLGSGGQQRA